MIQDKDDADWRAALSAEEYYVLREKGTERAFTGEYWNVFDEGTYHCRGCGEVLFQSDAKFDAHCGWPSFDRPASDTAVADAGRSKLGHPQCASNLASDWNNTSPQPRQW